MLKKIVSWLNDCVDTRPRCMFDRKRICSPEHCNGFSRKIEEKTGEKGEKIQRIILLSYGIKDQQGNEVYGPCLVLAAQANIGNVFSIFNKKVVAGIISDAMKNRV